ncbi:MAG: hypothetical protein ACI9LM_005620 [Alteromonadaceae bacterium]|jgi:hypothetical protein
MFEKVMSKLILILIFIFHGNLFAGTNEQKNTLTKVIQNSNYQELFKYYSVTDQVFNRNITIEGSGTHNVLDDERALEQLSTLFSSIQLSRDLPYYITDEARYYGDTLYDRVDEKYPKGEGKRYWAKALELGGNTWTANWKALGGVKSTKLIFAAAMTGPKLGLDIAAGGVTKIGAAIKRGTKVVKKIRKIKNIKSIKKVFEIKDITKILKVLDKLKDSNKTRKRLKKLKSLNQSGIANKTFDMITSESFQYFLKISNYALTAAITIDNVFEGILKDPREKAILELYAKEHANEEFNYIAQFWTEVLFTEAADLANSMNSTTVALFIHLSKTGVLGVMNSENDELINEDLQNITEDVLFSAGEFIPVAGPFFELFNANKAAMASIQDNKATALLLAETFSKARIELIDLENDTYKLMVLEGIIAEINNYSYKVKDNLYANEHFGTRASLNSFASAIYEIGEHRPITDQIFTDFYDCRVEHVQKTNERFVHLRDNLFTRCDSDKGYFKVVVSVGRGNIDPQYNLEIELLVTLDDLVLYKLPANVNFIDVDPNSHYYPYIKSFGYKNIISSENDYFLPENALKQFELAALLTKTFYKKDFYQFNLTQSVNDQNNYYGFLEQKIGWAYSIDSKDEFITYDNIAVSLYLVFKTEFELQPDNVSHQNGTNVIWSIKSNTWLGTINHSLGWSYSPLFLKVTGIESGYRYGNFGSHNNISRGDSIVMLYKALKLMEENK